MITEQTLIASPDDAKLIAEVLADKASDGKYPRRKAYQVLRSLSPSELYNLWAKDRDSGSEGFRQVFGSIYHDKRGERIGPLFG